VIETDLGRDAPEELVRENITPVIEATPIGRSGQPEEVANVVCFLCSQRASFVNGSCMTVYIIQDPQLTCRWMVVTLRRKLSLVEHIRRPSMGLRFALSDVTYQRNQVIKDRNQGSY